MPTSFTFCLLLGFLTKFLLISHLLHATRLVQSRLSKVYYQDETSPLGYLVLHKSLTHRSVVNKQENDAKHEMAYHITIIIINKTVDDKALTV